MLLCREKNYRQAGYEGRQHDTTLRLVYSHVRKPTAATRELRFVPLQVHMGSPASMLPSSPSGGSTADGQSP